MRLVDLFETKYIAAHWGNDLRYFLDLLINDKTSAKWATQLSAVKSEGKPYVIDLAEASICRDAMNFIMHYNHEDVKFIDTHDPVRNGMLEENSRRRELNYKTIPLPTIESQHALPDYLLALEQGIVYDKGVMEEGLAVRLAIIIQTYRPEIMLDMTGLYEQIFSYIASSLNMRDFECDKVSYIIGTTFFTQDVIDGQVHVPGEGNIPWDKFISRYTCIPAEFGTKRLSIDEMWRPLIQECIRTLPMFIDKRVSITDYFSKE